MDNKAGMISLIINAIITVVVIVASTALAFVNVMPVSTYIILIIAATGINGSTALVGSISQNAKETINTIATETQPTQRRPQ